jgi:predicted nucleotidyltransferase
MAKVNLYPDFKEFLELLNSHGVKYLILGGYAVIYYGYRRMTDDLDIWIAVDEANAQKISQSLQKFGGFPPSKIKPSMFLAKETVFIIGREPIRIDILTSPSGLDFQECYQRRREVVWDGTTVPLISLEDLKKNKKASGRLKDKADLENLLKSSPKRARASRRRPT